jgi:hypothetical protein
MLTRVSAKAGRVTLKAGRVTLIVSALPHGDFGERCRGQLAFFYPR